MKKILIIIAIFLSFFVLMFSEEINQVSPAINISWEKLDFLTKNMNHPIDCEAQTYEFYKCEEIVIERVSKNHIKLKTLTNPSTHSILILNIINNKCYPLIELNSITKPGKETFAFESGFVKVDKELFNKNILKAEFDFKFHNHLDSTFDIFWKGRIYTEINQ